MSMINIKKTMRTEQTLMGKATSDMDITISVDPGSTYPDNIMLTLLWLSQYCMFSDDPTDEYSLQNFREDITIYGNSAYQRLVDHYFDAVYKVKYGSQRNMLKLLLAPPQPVIGKPPYSKCPRCDYTIWAKLSDSKHVADLRVVDDPEPVYCLECGQLFKYTPVSKDSDEQLMHYKDTISMQAYAENVRREQIQMQKLAESLNQPILAVD